MTGVVLDPDVGVQVAEDAVGRAVKAGAHGAKAVHSYRERFEVNFDSDDISLVRSTVADTMTLTVFDDTRKGSVETSGRSPDEVDAAVASALEAARAGQADPANVLPEEPAPPAPSRGDDTPDKEAMVDAVVRHIAKVKESYPALRTDASSHYAFTCSWSSYANSHGRTQHARHGAYTLVVMLTGRDGTRATSFNYASHVAEEPVADLTTLAPVELLIEDTLASFDPQPIPETFVGDVIFTPHSLGTVIGSVTNALTGLSIMRSTTPYADRLGTRIAAPALSLLHRPHSLPAAGAFDGEGFVNVDLDVIKDGELTSFLIDWYTAHKLDRPMTSAMADLVVEPGDVALADLIAGTERGILLGRYSGGMPNPNLDFSGVAKNSFYVEDGAIRFPIHETMVAGNFGSVLERIHGISRETLDDGSSRFPWLAADGVTVSTK